MTVHRWTSFPGIRVQLEDGKAPTYFYSAVEMDLQRIASQSIGKDLLDIIDKRSRGIGIGFAGATYPHVTVCYTRRFTEASARTEEVWSDTTRREGRFGVYGPHGFRKSGGGHYMWVGYCPNPIGTTACDYLYTREQGIQTPAFIVLAHELIHAWHGVSGTMETEDTQGIALPDGRVYEISREEAYTVGLGPYANTRISENAIRAEHQLPRRTRYATPGDCDGFMSHQRPRRLPTAQEIALHGPAMLLAAQNRAAQARADADNWW